MLNRLTKQGNRIIIQGFDDLIGQLVQINIHSNGVVFKLGKQSNSEQCIRFNEKTLNSKIVIDFLNENNIFNTTFVKVNNSYLPNRSCIVLQ